MSLFTFPKKRFGQHFLHDRNVIHKIIRAIAPEPSDFMVEIGPGRGALTAPLLEHLEQLYAIEVDRDLAALLRQSFPSSLHLIEEDVLNFNFKNLSPFRPGQALRVVGNLPYNISTPILFHLLDFKDLIQDMHFMLQKEVVARICAPSGSKTYGRLSVMIQAYCETQALFPIYPGAFQPPPQVDSMLLYLKPYQNPRYFIPDPLYFAEIVRCAFQNRRKTLKNALRNLPTVHIDKSLINLRPEALSVADFVHLSGGKSL